MSKGFYIHLDAMLDTRAGVIKRLNPEGFTNIIKTNHHLRKGDFWQGIDPVAYREMYEKHEQTTLEESTMTNVFYFLHPQMLDLMKESLAHEMPEHKKPTLDVNVWPYELSADEKAYLRSVCYVRFNGIISVNIIDRPIAELTPGLCSEQYHLMVMYDYHHWLNEHSSALITTPRPLLILVAPMVYFNRDPETDEETIDQLKQGINSLELLGAALAPRIRLQFIDVSVFSIVYPDDRITKVDLPETDNGLSLDEFQVVLDEQRAKAKP